jgi:hypothetical protein
MNGRVIRSDLALADLAEQSEYIRQHNPRTALRFLTESSDWKASEYNTLQG